MFFIGTLVYICRYLVSSMRLIREDCYLRPALKNYFSKDFFYNITKETLIELCIWYKN